MLPEGEGNRLGKFQAIAFVIGDIIGSGIFVSPSSILKHSGSVGLSLCIWAAGALIASIGALVYVELGTSIRKSGCDFAYLTHVRWYPLAAGFLWVSVTLTYPTILAIQTITLGEYVVAGIHQVRPLDLSWHPALARLIGFTFLWVLVYLNLFSLRKFSARLQVVVTTSKLLVISVIAITGFYYMIFKGRTEAFEHGFAKSETDPGEIVLALYASLFAYNGWDILNFGTEEIENPRSTLPIAALCGIAVSAGVYVAINAAYFSVLTIEEFKTSEAVAMDFAAKTLGDVKYLVPFLIALLLLGNLNSTIFGCSRYVFAGARNNVMPSFLECVHPSSMSPRAAVLIELCVAIGVSFLGNLDQLLSYMTFAMWMQRTIVQIALIWMRLRGWTFPKDAFRTPIIVPLVFFCICIMLLVLPVKDDYHVAIYGVTALLAGMLMYFVFVYPANKPAIFYRVNEKMVVITQLLLNTVPHRDD